MPTCAMLWHGTATWMSGVCVCPHVRVCLDLLFPDREYAPACDCLCKSAGELPLVRVRVNSSSYGQMPPSFLSRQWAATKKTGIEVGLRRDIATDTGLCKHCIATVWLSWLKRLQCNMCSFRIKTFSGRMQQSQRVVNGTLISTGRSDQISK